MFYRPFNANNVRVLIIVGALTALLVLVWPVYNLAFAQEDETIEYAEKGMEPVATFTATDPDAGDSVTWSVDGNRCSCISPSTTACSLLVHRPTSKRRRTTAETMCTK